LEKSRDAGDSDVERFHGYSSAVPHIVQTGPFPVYHRSYYTAAFRWIRVGIGALIAFQIQAKNKAVISAEYFLQILSRSSTRRLFIGYTATNEGAPDLIVEIFAVGHDYKSKIPWSRASYFLSKERHGVGLAASLRVPEHAEPAQVRVRPFY